MSTRIDLADPNFCLRLVVPVRTPKDLNSSVFATSVNITAIDNRVVGCVPTTIGTGVISLLGRLEGAPGYKKPRGTVTVSHVNPSEAEDPGHADMVGTPITETGTANVTASPSAMLCDLPIPPGPKYARKSAAALPLSPWEVSEVVEQQERVAHESIIGSVRPISNEQRNITVNTEQGSIGVTIPVEATPEEEKAFEKDFMRSMKAGLSVENASQLALITLKQRRPSRERLSVTARKSASAASRVQGSQSMLDPLPELESESDAESDVDRASSDDDGQDSTRIPLLDPEPRPFKQLGLMTSMPDIVEARPLHVAISLDSPTLSPACSVVESRASLLETSSALPPAALSPPPAVDISQLLVRRKHRQAEALVNRDADLDDVLKQHLEEDMKESPASQAGDLANPPASMVPLSAQGVGSSAVDPHSSAAPQTTIPHSSVKQAFVSLRESLHQNALALRASLKPSSGGAVPFDAVRVLPPVTENHVSVAVKDDLNDGIAVAEVSRAPRNPAIIAAEEASRAAAADAEQAELEAAVAKSDAAKAVLLAQVMLVYCSKLYPCPVTRCMSKDTLSL